MARHLHAAVLLYIGVGLTPTDRDDPACAWQAPVNLGSPINTTGADFAPNLSGDGHLLFFASNRGGGATDIFVSHRADPNDDFGWEDPVPLGPGVNTAAGEQAPMYLQNAEDGSANLYFNRGALAQNQADIYVAAVTRDGETLGPAQLVVELSDPSANDAAVTIRADGRELMFWSPRVGGLGGIDLWMSTRQTIHDSWLPPVNAGTALNSALDDVTPQSLMGWAHVDLRFQSAGGLGRQRPLHVDPHAQRALARGSYGNSILHAARCPCCHHNALGLWRGVQPRGVEARRDVLRPVNLGPDVNTPDAEQGPAYVVSDRGGALYFTRGALASNAADLYRVDVGRDGRTPGSRRAGYGAERSHYE
jgi:hypothetical protein